MKSPVLWFGRVCEVVPPAVRRSACRIVGVLAIVAGAADTTVQAQVQLPAAKYTGLSNCSSCHVTADKPNYIDEGRLQRVRLTEYGTWHDEDLHAHAFEKLLPEKNPRAARMQAALGDQKKLTDPATGCIACHSIHAPPEQLAGISQENLHAQGITCEACHGPSSNWNGFHQQPDWKDKTPADKSLFGMIDMQVPEQRARMCASCHIGDSAAGKVITHEMYAAGHPPLPGLEMESFSNNMPRHWFFTGRTKKGDPTAHERTRLLAVGAAVNWQASLELLAAEAAQAEAHGWPRLAQFDCSACHHGLVPSNTSWRQANGYAGAPGRPGPRSWPQPLLLAVVRHVRGDQEQAWSGQLAGLSTTLSHMPFGAPEAVAKLATESARWTDETVVRHLVATPGLFDQAGSRKFLMQLCSIAADPRHAHDYDSAREIAWAMRQVYAELDPKPAADVVRPLLDDLATELRLDRSDRKPWAGYLTATNDDPNDNVLPEHFTKAREHVPIFGPPKGIDATLAAALANRASYDPERFRAAAVRLQKALVAGER